MPSNSDSSRMSPFLPTLLLAISLVMVLGWNLNVSVRQAAGARQMRLQQEQAAGQVVQTEAKLKAMLTGLVDLAKDDPDAQAIVERYGIRQNAPSGAAAAADPKEPKAAAEPKAAKDQAETETAGTETAK